MKKYLLEKITYAFSEREIINALINEINNDPDEETITNPDYEDIKLEITHIRESDTYFFNLIFEKSNDLKDILNQRKNKEK